MAFHSVVERIPIVPALDPLWLLVFTVVFAAAATMAVRRPAYAAGLLASVVPFALAHATAGTTITLGKAALVGVFAGLLARKEPLPLIRLPRAVVIAFAVVVAANLTSGLHARYPAEVLREMLKWTEYAGYFIAVFLCYELDRDSKVVRLAVTASVLAVTCSAFAELAFGAGWSLDVLGVTIPRIAGTLEGPNQLGGYLEIAVAMLAAWQIRERTPATAIVLALAGAALAMCWSRAALAGTIVALITIALVERARIAGAWTLVAGLCAGYAATLLGVRGISPLALLAAVFWQRASDVDAAFAGGLGSRRELWQAAITLFRHSPIVGVGAGNYQYDLPLTGLRGVRTQANEWYLQALAEGGIILLLATLAWIVSVVRTLTATRLRSAWSLGALAATCAMVVHGFSDDLVFYPKVAELWMVALALGCVREP